MDLTSHTGLRGVAAMWIMIFHYVLFSTHALDFQGSSLMPLFFLLSGFSLAVSYGRKHNLTSNVFFFYRNRGARVYPVYFLCTLFALPLWFVGFGDAPPKLAFIIPSIITSILPLCTLFIFLLGACIDGPGWTVCTLLLMWLCFPYSMEAAKKKSDQELASSIVFHFWLQLIIIFVAFPLLILILGFWPAFAAATMNPISRYPVFLMGIYAGELCVRYPSSPFPYWPRDKVFFPCSQGCGSFINPASDRNEVAHWSRVANTKSLIIFICTLVVSSADALARDLGGTGGILGAVWFQAIVPYCQLEIIIAVTRDGGESLASRFLRHAVWLELGKLSMCIYLIHYPIMQYTYWVLNNGRALEWPDDCDAYERNNTKYDKCEDTLDHFNNAHQLPLWCIPVLSIISLLISIALYHVIEVPTRDLLRADWHIDRGLMVPAGDEDDGGDDGTVEVSIVSVAQQRVA